MNYHNITTEDMVNGTGLRTVLWVAGCNHHCKECHNPNTWDPNGGSHFGAKDEEEFFEKGSKDYIEGITFSGGDPLHPQNREKIGQLAEKFKKTHPEKNIWVYTGYHLKDDLSFEDEHGECFYFSHLSYIDVLIDGKYESETRRNDLQSGYKPAWRGSSNQRLIDVQNSIKQGKIVLVEEETLCCI